MIPINKRYLGCSKCSNDIDMHDGEPHRCPVCLEIICDHCWPNHHTVEAQRSEKIGDPVVRASMREALGLENGTTIAAFLSEAGRVIP